MLQNLLKFVQICRKTCSICAKFVASIWAGYSLLFSLLHAWCRQITLPHNAVWLSAAIKYYANDAACFWNVFSLFYCSVYFMCVDGFSYNFWGTMLCGWENVCQIVYLYAECNVKPQLNQQASQGSVVHCDA